MKNKGFTLAELLIALAILGVIATFTIPKVLNAGQSGQNTAIAKEAASMISGSFSSYQLNNAIVGGTAADDLTQFLNYVSVATAGETFTGTAGTALQACSATLQCLMLHNGGVLQYDSAQSFSASATPATTNAIFFNVDPDGNGTQGRATFVLYSNGRLTTAANVDAGTATNGGTITTTTTDPAYIATWN